MATAISKGTAVHSKAMGKGKGRLNASHSLKALSLRGNLYPQSLLPTGARAHWVSPTVLVQCCGLQHDQQSNTRPLQFACHVQPLLSCSHQPGQEGVPDMWGPLATGSGDATAHPEKHCGEPRVNQGVV